MPPNESNTRPRPKAHNDHNVYILGAGFAAEAGLPLIKDFMNRMRDAAAWLEGQSDRQREIAAIENVLDFRLKAAAAACNVALDVENVEELFSLASASAGGRLAEDIGLAIAATLDFARHDFQEREAQRPKEYRFYQVGVADFSNRPQPPNWGPPLPNVEDEIKQGRIKGQWYTCPPYEFYTGIIGGYFNPPSAERRDTIITFNYDLTIETALYALEIPFSYGLSGKSVNFGLEATGSIVSEECASQDALRLLKLHGSVNWAPPDEVGKKLTLYRGYDEVRQNHLTPLLVPPTWRKYFAGQLSEVWDAAVKALRTATRIIILGYSMPTTDIHFKFLLAAGLQDNISLRKLFFVNSALSQQNEGEELKSRLFNMVQTALFDRGTVEFIDAKTSEFFHGPKDTSRQPLYRESIGRPLPAFYTASAPYMTFPPYF